MAKSKINEDVKQDFIDKLSSMSDEDIQNYIKENGKNNSNDKLFIFHWENINPKNK
jgi:hypothetical protein